MSTDPRRVLEEMLSDPSREFDVELWDGRVLARGSAVGPCYQHGTLVLRTPHAASLFGPWVAEARAARAFVEGQFDIRGNTVEVLEALARWRGPRVGPRGLAAAVSAWARAAWRGSGPRRAPLGVRHSIRRDARAVKWHYDVSDDFYRLFLDRRMIYSCAYFPRGDESLDHAQEEKLALTCRKLNLQRGETLLDVGCGWGGLLLYAAGRVGARVTGTTVSSNQWREARRAARASSLGPYVEVLGDDYRKLPDRQFDKISSVGMMEHVGAKRLDEYFRFMFMRLRPGGLFLNHAIADVAPGHSLFPWLQRSSTGFIKAEIFPDSELPTLGAVVRAAERQGLEVRDVECLREHYTRTLGLWLANLERRFEEAVALVGLRRARAWRLYLAGSAVAFSLGRVGIYQTLLARRTGRGVAVGIPRSRGRWYEGEAASQELPSAS